MDTENLVSMTPDIYPDIHYKFKNKINLMLPPSLEKARKKNYISIKLTVRDVLAKADNEKFEWKLKKRIVLYLYSIKTLGNRLQSSPKEKFQTQY